MGEQPQKRRGYVVASRSVIIDVIGMLQMAEQEFVSLDRINHAFRFLRSGEAWVNYYQLKQTLSRMVEKKELATESVHRRGRVITLYSVADWEDWWLGIRTRSMTLSTGPDFVQMEPSGDFAWIEDPVIRRRAQRDPEFAATILAESGE